MDKFRALNSWFFRINFPKRADLAFSSLRPDRTLGHKLRSWSSERGLAYGSWVSTASEALNRHSRLERARRSESDASGLPGNAQLCQIFICLLELPKHSHQCYREVFPAPPDFLGLRFSLQGHKQSRVAFYNLGALDTVLCH
jgi:hypothetical protein